MNAERKKHGFLVDDVQEAASKISSQAPRLLLRGLMCIPKFRQPVESDLNFERRARRAYSTMAQLFAKIRTSLPDPARWDTLSMGMSQDYVWAIEEGATMV